MAAPAVELGVEAATVRERKGERKHKVRADWNGKKSVVIIQANLESLKHQACDFSLKNFCKKNKWNCTCRAFGT